MKIYTATNNGVVAVISEKTKALIEARIRLIEESGGRKKTYVPYPHRIHTFSNSTHHKGWVNGTRSLLGWLIEQSKAEVIRNGFYVPFSNGIQWTYRVDPERAEEEWRFRTSADELLEDFGLL